MEQGTALMQLSLLTKRVACPHLLNRERINPDIITFSRDAASLPQKLYIKTLLSIKTLSEAHAARVREQDLPGG